MLKRIYITTFIVFISIVVTWFTWVGDDTNRPYKRIELGMKESEASSLFDANPEYVFYYEGYRIVYYRSPSRLRDHMYRDIEGYVHGMKVDTLADLPDYYGYYQLAFDTNELLVAYTWIGETYTVESVDGPVKGSHLSKLGRMPTTK